MTFIEARNSLQTKIATLEPTLNFYPNNVEPFFVSPFLILQATESETNNFVNYSNCDNGKHFFTVTLGKDFDKFSSETYQALEIEVDRIRRNLTKNLPIRLTTRVEYTTSVNNGNESFIAFFDIETLGE